jgi:hypothetical protein
VKTLMLLRLVKRRVFDGGVGCVRGGMLDKSRLRLDLREAEEEERDDFGNVSILLVVDLKGGCRIGEVLRKKTGVHKY